MFRTALIHLPPIHVSLRASAFRLLAQSLQCFQKLDRMQGRQSPLTTFPRSIDIQHAHWQRSRPIVPTARVLPFRRKSMVQLRASSEPSRCPACSSLRPVPAARRPPNVQPGSGDRNADRAIYLFAPPGSADAPSRSQRWPNLLNVLFLMRLRLVSEITETYIGLI